ncbi:MAG: hypothetical protein IKV32_00240 [Muribaculaceae bacterium]|nr:hypothetical protein [Muribaculaceae bacterium]
MVNEKYNQWVDKVCEFIEEVGPCINGSSSAMQSPPVLNGKCRILFLGHDAHEQGFYGADRARFYEGNKTFKDAHRTWRYWTRPYNSFHRIGKGEILDSGNYMLMNLFYFGNDDINRSNARMGVKVMQRCIEFSEELICHIIQPKVVVCFSIGSVFNPLRSRMSNIRRVVLSDNVSIMQSLWNGIPIIGMSHPSARSISNHYLDTIFNYVSKISI